MPKISDSTIVDMLKEHYGTDEADAWVLVEKMINKEKEEQDEKKEKPEPKDWIVLIDTEHDLPDDITAWIAQKEKVSVDETMCPIDEPRVWGDLEAGRLFAHSITCILNDDSKRSKKLAATTSVESMMKVLKPVLKSESGLNFKNKYPCSVIPVDLERWVGTGSGLTMELEFPDEGITLTGKC